MPSAALSVVPSCSTTSGSRARAAIRKNRVEVIALLDEIIAERPLSQWSERFDREGVWWAPVQSPAEVVVDPQLLANNGVVEVEGGALRSVNGPVTFSDVVAEPARVVPKLGDHTAEVLEELSRGTARRRGTGTGDDGR